MITTIVVGFDGSETAERALRLACDMAGGYEAQVHLVHTPQPQTVAFAMGGMAGYHTVTTMPSQAEVNEGNAKIVAAGEEIAKSCECSIEHAHVETGEPADVIVRYAGLCDADLIVTGRRGLGGIGSMIQGSTSLRVNHLAKCATLSVV